MEANGRTEETTPDLVERAAAEWERLEAEAAGVDDEEDADDTQQRPDELRR
jgi:hypothetical protein